MWAMAIATCLCRSGGGSAQSRRPELANNAAFAKTNALTVVYAVKEIRISPNRLSSISSALTSIRRAYEVVGITVLKYWYEVLVRFIVENDMPIVCIPLQLRLCSAEKVIATDVLSISIS
jgi:hypothetical protein